jgi:hypothetical protein
MKCKHCGHEIEDRSSIKIKELRIEVETEIHDKDKTLKEIEIPKGWRLLTLEEIMWLHNSKYKKKLNLDDTWEFIEQPFKINKENNFVARFVANSDRANLYCNGIPDYSYSSLGVRFCRDLKKGDKMKKIESKELEGGWKFKIQKSKAGEVTIRLRSKYGHHNLHPRMCLKLTKDNFNVLMEKLEELK